MAEVVATPTLDWDAIEKLTDVIEATQRVHLPFLLPIQQLALSDLKPYAIKAQEELDKRAEALAAIEAKKAEEAKKEADALAKKEDEANKIPRRELPPLTAPPAR